MQIQLITKLIAQIKCGDITGTSVSSKAATQDQTQAVNKPFISTWNWKGTHPNDLSANVYHLSFFVTSFLIEVWRNWRLFATRLIELLNYKNQQKKKQKKSHWSFLCFCNGSISTWNINLTLLTPQKHCHLLPEDKSNTPLLLSLSTAVTAWSHWYGNRFTCGTKPLYAQTSAEWGFNKKEEEMSADDILTSNVTSVSCIISKTTWKGLQRGECAVSSKHGSINTK